GEDALEAVTTTFTVDNIWADLTSVSEEDPESGAVIEALGLTMISGNVSQVGTWTLADGRLTMDEFVFDFADIGKLDHKMDITGFTTDVLNKMYAMSPDDIDMESEEGQAQQTVKGME